jgi:Bacterial protein of unknown function (DUF899)
VGGQWADVVARHRGGVVRGGLVGWRLSALAGLVHREAVDDREQQAVAGDGELLGDAAVEQGGEQSVGVAQRASLAVVAKSPIGRILAIRAGRGWNRLRFVSSRANSYNRDYLGETPAGEQRHRLNVFVRDGEAIRHHWCSEDLPSDPGQETRITDLIWPLWHLLDLTPHGRGDDPDFPRLSYER